MTDSLPVSLIDEFLNGYEPANLGRPMTGDERALVEEVLFDFIVTDLPTELSSELRYAFGVIRDQAPTLADGVEQQLHVIERACRKMACQMQRREKSFDIMREHLTVLSERSLDS